MCYKHWVYIVFVNINECARVSVSVRVCVRWNGQGFPVLLSTHTISLKYLNKTKRKSIECTYRIEVYRFALNLWPQP